MERFRALSDKASTGSALNNLGQTLYRQGNLVEAAKTLGQALDADREAGNKLETADALSWLGRVQLEEANCGWR